MLNQAAADRAGVIASPSSHKWLILANATSFPLVYAGDGGTEQRKGCSVICPKARTQLCHEKSLAEGKQVVSLTSKYPLSLQSLLEWKGLAQKKRYRLLKGQGWVGEERKTPWRSNTECLTVCWKVLLLSAIWAQYREVMGLQLQKGKFGLQWRKRLLPERTKLLNRRDSTSASEVCQGTHNPSSKHLLTPHKMGRRTRQIHRAPCSPTINRELLRKEVKKSETCPDLRALG